VGTTHTHRRRARPSPTTAVRRACGAAPAWRVDCAATTLSTRAGRTSTHSCTCYWCDFCVHAHEALQGYYFSLQYAS
jgi:hypothetical protein